MNINYITLEQAIDIHQKTVKYSGGGTCQFHCFEDGNKRLAITLAAYFLLLNGYMAVAKDFFSITENISYHVAAGKIDKELLRKIMLGILDGTYEFDEELKLEIVNAISAEDIKTK